MPEFSVNLVAVIAAVVAMQVLGFLWYGPLFGKIWMRSTGKTQEEMGGPGLGIVVGLVANVISALVLAWLLNTAGEVTVATGVAFGLLVCVGFVITTSAIQSVYENRNPTTAGLYITYNLVGYAVMGAILGALS